MKIKSKKTRIILLLSIFVFFCLVLGNVYANITTASGEVRTSETGALGLLDIVASGVDKIVEYIFGMAASGLFATVTNLINILTLAMYLALTVLFNGVIAEGAEKLTTVPMPDTIVFNRYSFFDANFISPADHSVIGGMGTVLKDLFASFQTIAISLFIIAAMVLGIKTALSSVAIKKAQYKEAAMKWIGGFLLLLCIRWILAGIFYINETLVAKMYIISKSADVTIPVYPTEALPVFGKPLTDLFKGVASLWGGNGTLIEIPGYFGIFIANLCKSIGGNIIASIMGFIIMGQTFTIVGSYIKRVFMCILLGMVSPLVVVVDTLTSVIGKPSNVLRSWLKNFSTTVFMQTFHAAYMVVALQILAKLYGRNTLTNLNATQVGIVSIVLITGLVKLEKLIKGMFGIGDSLAGDLKNGTKSIKNAMESGMGLLSASKAIGDNVPKMNDAVKRKEAYGKQLNALKGPEKAKEAFDKAKEAKKNGNMEEYHKQMKIAAEARNDAKSIGITFDKKGNPIEPSSSSSSSSKENSNDYLKQVLNQYENPTNMTREDKIHKVEEGYAQAMADYKSAALATIMGPANLAAGIGLSIGMGDDISGTLMKGGMITATLDKGAELVGSRAADKDRKSFYQNEKKDGEKYGYEPSEKIIREKTTVEKTLGNGQLYINPVAVAKEWKKQFSEIGDVFGDTVKKKMKEIDKDLDNQ